MRSHRPDVLVLDVSMPAPDGIGVLRAIREEGLATRTVLLTVALDDNQLVEAARRVHAGGQYLEGGIVGRALQRMAQREDAAREATRLLTPREVEIVRMVSAGLRNRAIGEKLFISEGTVKVHLHRIYEKLEVGGRLELLLYAREKGLV